MSYRVNGENGDTENNTAVASASSNDAETFLDAERVDGSVAGVDETVLRASLMNSSIDRHRRLVGNVELPAEFTDKGQTHCTSWLTRHCHQLYTSTRLLQHASHVGLFLGKYVHILTCSILMYMYTSSTYDTRILHAL